MELSYPKVKKLHNGDYFVEFTLGSKRFRLVNGNKIKLNLKPNTYPLRLRKSKAELLAKEVYRYLISNNYSFDDTTPKNELELYDFLVRQKLNEPLSRKYKMTIESIANEFRGQVVSYKTIPIDDVASLLAEIKAFNFNLFLCCSLTYGCLLRPHREIRLLKWGDFSDDLKYVSVDGSRIKSKRNRIVPIPEFIRRQLNPTNKENNVFSNRPIEFNEDYFKTLWSRFKKSSKVIKPDQTLYSFRHSGAIEIFKRTGSITKLQKAMGHSSMNVSLTYLRGLEIPELNEEDMPMI